MLFSSGVGFFEHAGQVTDDAKVEMKFKTADINDLLKSMVVQDLDGGRVSTVTYASKDPITKTLQGLRHRSDDQSHAWPNSCSSFAASGSWSKRPTS